MTDDKTKPVGQDRKRVDLHQDSEVRDWAEKFGVSPSDIRQAAEAVGNDASRIKWYLKRRK